MKPLQNVTLLNYAQPALSEIKKTAGYGRKDGRGSRSRADRHSGTSAHCALVARQDDGEDSNSARNSQRIRQGIKQKDLFYTHDHDLARGRGKTGEGGRRRAGTVNF